MHFLLLQSFFRGFPTPECTNRCPLFVSFANLDFFCLLFCQIRQNSCREVVEIVFKYLYYKTYAIGAFLAACMQSASLFGKLTA